MGLHERRVAVLSKMESWVGLERRCQARFLECLGEFDAREWFTFEACSSSFAYLTQRMGYCSHAAWRRLATARVARKFPFVLDMIRRGDLHMTGVAMVSKLLDGGGGESLLRAIVGKSKRAIQEIIADLDPKPVGDSTVRDTSPGGSEANSTPLGSGRWRVELFAGVRLKALIDEAMELSPPGTDLAVVVEQALSSWIGRKRTRKFGSRERASSGAEDVDAEVRESADDLEVDDRPRGESRYIPARIRRAVYDRDGGQCSFVDDSGRRCSERRGLEFDHLEPYCAGGGHSTENLRMVCSAHNRHAARESLGVEFMGQWYRRVDRQGGGR